LIFLTDTLGKSGDIRQPPAVGERVVAVDATAMARPQVEKVTAPMRGPPDTPEALTIAPAAVGVPPCDTAPARTPASRRTGRMGTVHAFKSRSPKEISALFDFIMARPDLAVDAPQGLAKRSADLTKMFDSDWKTSLATLSSYMGENALDMLIDFDATYIRTPGDDASWGHTRTTQPHATRTYMQDARKAAEEPVFSPTPTTPHQTHTTPNPPLLTPPLNQSPHLHAAWGYGEHAEQAQEKAGDREVRPGGDVGDGGGAELIAPQDEPHREEPEIGMPWRMRRRSKASGNGRRRRRTRSTRRTNRCSPPRRASRRGATIV